MGPACRAQGLRHTLQAPSQTGQGSGEGNGRQLRYTSWARPRQLSHSPPSTCRIPGRL